MKSIRVNLGERSYSIQIGSIQSELRRSLYRLPFLPTSILIVTGKNIERAGHLRAIKKAFGIYKKPISVVRIDDGESHKNLETLKKLYTQGLSLGLDRKSLVVAVGGGVITDLVGFFAATYMRGLAFVSIPTTLLAMVDASIGGKTGVDLYQGKNLVGAFWQPKLVWIDPKVLKTLPIREWRTGMAEVIKYGVIKDATFFSWLEQTVAAEPKIEKWPGGDLEKILYVSAKTKALVVSGDEHETPLAGGREILNFGHTLGHALEAATGYSTLTHGEAISIGMVLVGEMSLRLKRWNASSQRRLRNLLDAFKLPITFPRLSASQQKAFWLALTKDKKHVGGELRFVLPLSIGKVEVVSGIKISDVKKVL